MIGYIVEGENNKIKKDNLFAVRVDGNSMNLKEINGKKITNGSYVLVKKTSTAENGDIVLAIVNGNATIKEFHKQFLIKNICDRYEFPGFCFFIK